jgi:hypothetical protein
MRPTLPLLALALVSASFAAYAKTWSVSCAASACVAVDSEGGLAFIDLEKQTVNGVDKLTDAPKPPFNVSCAAKNVGEGCVIVDGDGRLWFGPNKPGTPYKASDAKLP